MKSKYLEMMKDFKDDKLLEEIKEAETIIKELKQQVHFPRSVHFVEKLGVSKQVVREMILYFRKKGLIESFYAEKMVLRKKPAKTKRYRLINK